MIAATWQRCAPGCPGWIVDAERDIVQACDACRRFRTVDGASDDHAARSHVVAVADGTTAAPTRETRRAKAWRRRHPAGPPYACPRCGNHRIGEPRGAAPDAMPIVWREWIPSERPIAVIAAGQLVVAADNVSDELDGEREHLYCYACGHEYPIPAGVDVHHDSGPHELDDLIRAHAPPG